MNPATLIKTKKTLGCKVTLFNKRRGMEFIKSTREEIQTAITVQESGERHNEMDECLSPIERKLTSSMNLLKVQGKMGKGVPVLLSTEDYELLKCLLNDPKCQKEVFLFQSDGDRPYRGDKMLHDLTRTVELEKPEAIRQVMTLFQKSFKISNKLHTKINRFIFRATALRKYLATVIQVMALPKYQMKWVAEHLGHNLEVHAKYYRQSIESVEVAKISKLMYLVDGANMQNLKGMDLDTIDEFIDEHNPAGTQEKQDLDDDDEEDEDGESLENVVDHAQMNIGDDSAESSYLALPSLPVNM